jgi:colanic acid biosynthesis glycosyl transferase WcaI
MNVLIVSAVFPPEPVTSAVTSEQLAVGLVNAGHHVTVITSFPSKPGGKLYPGYSQTFRRVEVTAKSGYRLIRTFSLISAKPTALSRFLENLSFGLTSTVNSLPLRPDVVYVNTWPIVAMGLVTFLFYIRNVPVVLNIQDIHPEAAIQLGKLPHWGPVPWILKYIDGSIARRSAALITISESFAEFYHTVRKVPRDRIHVVYNWMDTDEIKPGPRMGSFRKAYGISEDTFVIMYAGNVGAAADVQTIINAAAQLKDCNDVLFLIVGDGSNRLACESLAERYGLSNVRFFYPLLRHQVPEVQAAADLMVLPMHRSAALTSVPSKLIAYMLSAKPVLAAVDEDSDTAKVIHHARCGFCVKPEDPEVMAAKIRELLRMRDELIQMGQRARYYAEQNFSRKICVPKLISILEKVVDEAHITR